MSDVVGCSAKPSCCEYARTGGRGDGLWGLWLCGVGSVAMWRNGPDGQHGYILPSALSIKALADALDVSADWLLCRT